MTKYEKEMSKMGKAMDKMGSMYKKAEAEANRYHEMAGKARMAESKGNKNLSAAEAGKCLKY